MVRDPHQGGVPHKGRSVIEGAPQGAYPINDNARRQPGAEGFTKQTSDRQNASLPGKKWETVLRYLLNVGSLNRFEAETAVNDHCLHTSIASLRRDFGIECGRRFETVPCLKGRATTKVKRYWIEPSLDNLKRARAVLGMPEQGGKMTHAAFIRFKTLVGGGIILKAARHNTRELQNENGANGHIDPCRSALNVQLRGEATARAIDLAAKQLVAGAGITKQRKGGVQAIEIVCSLPIATSIDVYAYFEDCTRWTSGRFGENNVISSVIHLDEAAPHCHILVVPLRDGRMAGSDMLGRRKQFLEMLDEFHARVAGVYGLPKASPRLTKLASRTLSDTVLQRLKTTSDGAMSSAAWRSIREAIEDDPAPFAANLGIEIASEPGRAKSVVEIFTSTGKRTSEDNKPYRELSASKSHSLSCVGDSISRPASPRLLARTKPNRDDLILLSQCEFETAI